jgi:hypothetical protein
MIFHCYVSLPEGNGFHVGFHVGIWSSNPASRLHGEVFRRASGGSGNALTLNAKSRKLSLFSTRWSEPHCSGGHDQPILTHFPPSLGLVAMIHIFNSSDPSSFFASNYSSLFGGQKKSIYASLSGAYAQTSTYLYIYIWKWTYFSVCVIERFIFYGPCPTHPYPLMYGMLTFTSSTPQNWVILAINVGKYAICQTWAGKWEIQILF